VFAPVVSTTACRLWISAWVCAQVILRVSGRASAKFVAATIIAAAQKAILRMGIVASSQNIVSPDTHLATQLRNSGAVTMQRAKP
jgi:hypothetical protein